MRPVTVIDGFVPMKATKVKGNPVCPTVILLSRVIVHPGKLPQADTGIIEKLHPDDMAFPERPYMKINGIEDNHSGGSRSCPQCDCRH